MDRDSAPMGWTRAARAAEKLAAARALPQVRGVLGGGVWLRVPSAERAAGVVAGVTGVAAAFCYSAFLVAGATGSHLNPITSLVSALAVMGQPDAGLFRGLTAAAGGLLVVFAAALWRCLRPGFRPTAGRWRLVVGSVSLLLAGACGIVNAANPMVCVPELSRACARYEYNTSLLVQAGQPHTDGSVVQWLVLVTAMLVLGPAVSGRRGCGWMRWASPLAGVLVALAGSGEIALTVAGQLSGGALERGETLLISLWR